MKVSKEQKIEHQQRFILAFIAEVREQGYAAVSLRDVARRSGMSDGAIYKHFATKEKILLAYYGLRMDRLKAHGEELAARPGYTFAERMHALLEFQIGQYEGDKDFLAKTFRPTFIAASLMWSEVAAMRKTYVDTVRGFLAAAEAKGELPSLSLPSVVEEMVWCHYMAVMLYWQRDASERHDDTTQFLDRTLNLFAAVVGGPLLPMAQELVGFLVNRHLMPLLMQFGGIPPGAAWPGNWAGEAAGAAEATGQVPGAHGAGARASSAKASSARASSARASSARASSARASSARASSARASSARASSARASSARASSARASSARASSARASSAKAAGAKGTVTSGTGAKTAGDKVASANESSANESSANESSANESSANESSANESGANESGAKGSGAKGSGSRGALAKRARAAKDVSRKGGG